MLSSRLFWKLLAACAGLNLFAAVVFGLILSNWQEKQILHQVDLRLRDAALLARSDLAELIKSGPSDELQRRVRELGNETGIRFTLLNLEGGVIADSGRPTLAEVAKLDNHRHRPEVVQALAHGEGSSQRSSVSLETPYCYFALRVDDGETPVGVVRSALTVAAIQAETSGMRRLIWSLAAAIFACVLALSYWIVGHITNPMHTLTRAAEAIAAGDYQHRVYVANRDELGMLAGTFNRMGQELHTRVTQLSASHDRQSTVLEGMIEGVIAVDPRQRIVLANKAAGRLFEFRPQAIEGRPLLEVVRNHALHQAVTTAFATRRPQRLETTREGSDRLIADIHVTPLPGDPCPGVILVMHDTTELRRLESLRRDFVANVSHELKTPLSSIKAYAETLRNGAIHDPEASQTFLERIEDQADRLHHLIIDLLMLARIESAQQAFDIVSVPVADVVKECLDGHRAAADAKQIHLVVEPEQPRCSVRADREGLREILDNLVDNAIKYTPEDGKVSLSWSYNEGMCQISVADTGIGIGAEHRRRVFERFYRVDKARSRELGGTGLGLSIVKHLCQAFRGKVGVESEIGKGSVFTVSLPLA